MKFNVTYLPATQCRKAVVLKPGPAGHMWPERPLEWPAKQFSLERKLNTSII